MTGQTLCHYVTSACHTDTSLDSYLSSWKQKVEQPNGAGVDKRYVLCAASYIASWAGIVQSV